MNLNERRDKREPLGPKNARFWILHPCTCEWVKITLKPGKVLRWYHGENTDEGFSSQSFELEYHVYDDDLVVTLSTYNRSRDCDGLLEYEREVACNVNDLRAEDRPIESWNRKTNSLDVQEWIKIPDWQKVRCSQRDHTAEAAGY